LSIFKTTWIILKIDKVWIKDFIYTIFTSDYGKIKANKKLSNKEKALDIWYLINFEIETKDKRDIHKIRNVKIKKEFLNKPRNFEEINNYLMFLNIIYTKIPDWVAVSEVYDICEKINNFDKLDSIKLILSKLKIINITWELNLEHKNIMVSKILKFIHNSKIDDILKLNGINEEIKKELENIF